MRVFIYSRCFNQFNLNERERDDLLVLSISMFVYAHIEKVGAYIVKGVCCYDSYKN